MNKRRMSSTQPPNKERSCCSFSFKSNAQAEYPAFSQHVFTLWLAPKQSRQCRVCVPGNVMTGAGGEEKRCEKEIDNLTQLVSTYESFKVLHVFSCSFRMFHAGSTSFPGHSLGEICELCSSTTQHSAPHETTCRAVGGTGIRHTMKCQNMTPVKGIIHHDDTC